MTADGELCKKRNTFSKDCNKYRKVFSNTIKSHDLVLKVLWPETSRVEESSMLTPWARKVSSLGDTSQKSNMPRIWTVIPLDMSRLSLASKLKIGWR